MKKLLPLSLLSLSSLLPAEEADWNNSLMVWGEYLHFRRSESHNNDLIIDHSQEEADGDFKVICTTKDVIKKFKFEPGWRVGISGSSRHNTVEATYLHIHEWTGRRKATRPGQLYFSKHNPTFLQDYQNADHAAIKYESQFENGEVNYFHYVTPRKGNYVSAAWLFGLRYIHLWEEIDIAYTVRTNRSNYQIHVKNHMGAVQTGGTLQWNPTKNLSWDFSGKVGMAYDWAKERIYLGDCNNTAIIQNFKDVGNRFPAFIADGSVVLGFQLLSFFNLHVGYELIYLNRVALAPDQIVKHTEGRHTVKVVGQALIYGIYGGATFNF